ncbi:MAG: hypothetical protein ACETVO_05050 [bacterium]
MATQKITEGTKLLCIWCGREVVVSNYGISDSTLLCCGRPMRKKSSSLVKKAGTRLPRGAQLWQKE